jgi:hypothetical protein
VKTTLDLPDDLVRRMKIRAVEAGIPLKRLVTELLRQSLNAAALPPPGPSLPDAEHVMLNEKGFPVIRCGPNAPASRMTAEQLVALEHQTLLEEDTRRAGGSL